MADYILSHQFLEDLAAFEKSASARDLKSLEETLAAIIQNPNVPGRVPSFYDPSLPSYLYRSGSLLIHYRTPRPGVVEFLNLFWPKI
ncbi:MAG: hypothetical protein HYV04_12855 [Deltaproteobacteria bacterium]|nr:hypothetical protein [Deltaproteobacteria bacterium]